MQSQRFNIAIVPSEEVSESAINLSRKLSINETPDFVLDGKKFIPHFTIYSPEFPSKNLDKILKVVEEISRNLNTFEINLADITTGEGFIMIEADKSDRLAALNKLVVNKINPLREGVLREKYKEKEYLDSLSIEEQNYILNYGYPKVLNNYPRHLSLIKFPDQNIAEQKKSDLNWTISKMKVAKIGVFEMGPFGTCSKLIQAFKLD